MTFSRKALLAGSWLALLAVFVQASLSLSPALHVSKPDEMDLSGVWQLCEPTQPSIQGCVWSPMSVPSKLDRAKSAILPGWLIYRRKFKTPEACSSPSAACVLIIGEVGDAAEARLNGIVLGRHGDFPPKARYAKHYPARFELSRDILLRGKAENELLLTVYAMKRNQAGLTQGPLGVFSNRRGFFLTKSLIALNVIFPIVGCVALFLMGAIPALMSMFRREHDSRFYSFTGFCFAHSLFLLSFSEVPREYLPIWISGYLHFLSRIVSDWAFFNMVQKHYDFSSKFVRYVRWGYYSVIASFVLMFLYDGAQAGGREIGFDTSFLIMRLAFPLLLLPHLLGLIGALRSWDTLTGKVFAAMFALTLGMQAHDCLIFHGIILGAYAVKIYPVFIGAAFGWLTLQGYRQEREHLLVAEGIAEVLTQVAHDIRSPLDALECLAGSVSSLPAQDRRALQASISRIREIAYDVIRSYQEAATARPFLNGDIQRSQILPVKNHRVFDLIVSVLTEKRLQYHDKPGLKFGFQAEPAAYAAQARVDAAEFKRVISNLINNGVEAMGEEGSVGISLRLARRRIFLTIRDTGKGIPKELLSKIGQKGASYGKSHGCGLGVHHARACIQAWGGSLQIESPPGQGTTVILALPQAQAPSMSAPLGGAVLCRQKVS